MALRDWLAHLPIVFASSTDITSDVSSAARQGLVRRLAPRIYTTDLQQPLLELTRRHALAIANLRYPGAVLSYRSAFEMAPGDGHLFLTGSHERTDRLPGLTLRLVKGPGPLPGDTLVMDLYRASDARAYLENLRRTRRAGGVSRVLPRAQLEARLEQLLQTKGEAALNTLRDDARMLAPALDAANAFASLDDIIGTLLGTRDVAITAPAAIARKHGLPRDEARCELLEVLAAELVYKAAGVSRPARGLLRHERQNLSFFDAYFSNFIEGTTFEVDEARAIVFDRQIPAERPADAHDVQGTFELLIDDTEMRTSLAAFDELQDVEHVLQRRHRIIMGARAETAPGEYKTVANRAGQTVFVVPELVRGTVAAGFEIFKTLTTPFQRAAFGMFLITEVHPFTDGNGRLARATMNAELIAGDETPILIATAYRTDYLTALRRLSRKRDPGVYVRMLDHAQEFTDRLDFGDFDGLRATLEACNAFDDTGTRVLKLPPRY